MSEPTGPDQGRLNAQVAALTQQVQDAETRELQALRTVEKFGEANKALTAERNELSRRFADFTERVAYQRGVSDTSGGAEAPPGQADLLLNRAVLLFQAEHIDGEWLAKADSWRTDCLGHMLGHDMRLRDTSDQAPGDHDQPAPEPDGEDDAEVWMPPYTDCMDYGVAPCPHCDATVYHHRTGRCGNCGRRRPYERRSDVPAAPSEATPEPVTAGILRTMADDLDRSWCTTRDEMVRTVQAVADDLRSLADLVPFPPAEPAPEVIERAARAEAMRQDYAPIDWANDRELRERFIRQATNWAAEFAVAQGDAGDG